MIESPKKFQAGKQPDLNTLNSWVYEAHQASGADRRERWRDQQMYDGGDAQWSDDDWQKAEDAGIVPVTVNKIFPVVNLVLGTQILNRTDIVAKGRTQHDAEVSQYMTEGIKYVLDQNEGDHLITGAFRGQVIPGAGYLDITYNPDPRKERIKVAARDWLDMYWDPFGSAWFDPEYTRYVFYQPWKDLEAVQEMFPEKAQDIEAAFGSMAGSTTSRTYSQDDLSNRVEETRQTLASTGWVQGSRRRIRPVQMWYPVAEPCLFAVFADGGVYEIKDGADPREVYQIIQQAQHVSRSAVRRMWCCTFLGDLEIARERSPYPHDMYPFVPFLGYLDSYGFPYGIPRQIRPQQVEINRRRSMALALIKNRRLILEEGAVEDPQVAWAEANKLDGMILTKQGKFGSVKIEELGGLSAGQEAILRASEREIQEVSGANDETLGYRGNVQSGVALDIKYQRGITVLASMFDNAKRATKRMGELVCAMIQGTWTGEKVLRITDQLTSAEKFVVLNQNVQISDGIVRRNDITQGVYDIIVADAPATDTVREQHANLIMETIKKSPPEVLPQLFLLWMEISNLPNKEELMQKVRPIFGQDPLGEEDVSPEQRREQVLQVMEQERQQAQYKQAVQQKMDELAVAKLEAEIAEARARAAKYLSDAQTGQADSRTKAAGVAVDAAKTELEREKCCAESIESGVRLGMDMRDRIAPQVQSVRYPPAPGPMRIPAQAWK